MKSEGHILIIDDEASLRQTLARILQRAGLEVTTAANGESGLALVYEHPFDLVYLDIRMPDMNGLEVLKAIHAKLPELPVILFTAQPDVHSAVEALRHGATDYLLKPLKPQVVIDRTQAVLKDQEKNRRKRELQRQMDTLLAEFNTLQGAENGRKESTPVQGIGSNDRFLKRGTLSLDIYTRRVTMDDRAINLAPTSFDYLLVLTRHAPNVVDYQTLVVEAQGYQTDVREAQELTKWHIHHIREAIEPDAKHPRFIINVRGEGYRLVVD
jgi:DNA-binding response OmpR family regulator